MFSAIRALEDPAFFAAGYRPRPGVNRSRISRIDDNVIDRKSGLIQSGLEPPPRPSTIGRVEDLSVGGAKVQHVRIAR